MQFPFEVVPTGRCQSVTRRLCVDSLKHSWGCNVRRPFTSLPLTLPLCSASLPLFRHFQPSNSTAPSSLPMGRIRGRKRLSRMDAAVDAMVQFGFTEAQVKKRVKLLLRVYGGDDAWPFIEDCSYKELIEALLRNDAEEDQGNAIEDGQNVEDRCIEDETDVGTSNAVSDKEEGEIFENSASGDPGESTLSMVLASHPDQVSPPSVHEGGGGGVWKDILLTHPSGDTEATATVTGKEIIISPMKNSAPPASPQVRKITSPPSNSAPMRRQSRSQPCYGWIDSDDEDSPEFTYFEPAPGAFSAKPPKRVSFDITPEREGRRRRRPSRWDEKPE